MNDLTIKDVKELATHVCNGNLFGMPSPEATFSLMMLCQAEGLHPMQAMRRYHIIKGKPSMRADAMQAEFQSNGGKIQWLERTDKKCSAKFSHESGGELVVEWTIEMAEAAGLTANPTWKKFPRQMLSARVISEGVRAVYPAVVCGVYTPEEVSDFDTPKNVTPQPQPQKQQHVAPQQPRFSETIEDAIQVFEPESVEVLPKAKPVTGADIAKKIAKVRQIAIKNGIKTTEALKTWVNSLIGREVEQLTQLNPDELDAILAKMEE